MPDRLSQITLKPNTWLKQMAKLNPVTWSFSRSLRACIAIVLPMFVGYLTDTLTLTLWISMGAMFLAIGEREAPYVFTIQKILISAPIGASGFLMGYVGVWLGDWSSIVLLMAGVSFLCAILSSYNATLSVGCLQFLVMSAIALGNRDLSQYWQASLLILAGACVYLLLLVLEIIFKPHQIRKNAILDALQGLINICIIKQKNLEADLESARLSFNLTYQKLYTFMLQSRYQALGHNYFIDQTANIVQDLDNLFVALIACKQPRQIDQLKQHLDNLYSAINSNHPYPLIDQADFDFLQPINDLTIALWSHTLVPANPAQQKPKPAFNFKIFLQQLTPGRSTLYTAAALALCTALGYAMHWLDKSSHWYWVPMTIAIVMKPELGSIFVRAVQRTVGTAAGVMLGGILLTVVPVGLWFIAIIAAITFVLPWLAQRNYALSAFAMTPLVMVMMDFLSPSTVPLQYAEWRLADTLMGCAIVLLFGYLLWPRRHRTELNGALTQLRLSIAHYLKRVLDHRLEPQLPAISEARCQAYGRLVDMRTALQKAIAEPPPAGYEAAAWFPLVAAAARLCDTITLYSVSASPAPNSQEWQWLQQTPTCLETLSPLPPWTTLDQRELSPEGALIASIRKETHVRESLYEH